MANRVPYPPFRGDKLKIFNLAKKLYGAHELHLLTFAQSDEDWSYEEDLKKIFKTVQFIDLPKLKSVVNCIAGIFSKIPFQVHYFRSKEMTLALEKMISNENFDVIHVQHLRMAQYLEGRTDVPRILDLPDAFSLYWKRKQENTKNPFLRIFEKIEQRRVYNYEKILSSFNLSLVCSKEDKEYLEQEHQLTNISLLPNGVDTSNFYPRPHDYAHNHTLLFTGNMDYGPNIDAVTYFVEAILPLVYVKFPKVQFVIAGQRPVLKVLKLASDAINVTGFIENIADQYDVASVVVAPLRYGAGTQNKVLEAMAMGVPVVCSNIGFEGLGISSGEGAIMQTDPDDFAKSIIDLLSSEEMRQKVGLKGISIIQNKFSWDIIAKLLESYFQVIK